MLDNIFIFGEIFDFRENFILAKISTLGKIFTITINLLFRQYVGEHCDFLDKIFMLRKIMISIFGTTYTYGGTYFKLWLREDNPDFITSFVKISRFVAF